MHALRIDVVPHGFRSSFCDLAAECTDAPREVCELALAHVNGDRGGSGLHRRSDLFDRRRAESALVDQFPPRTRFQGTLRAVRHSSGAGFRPFAARIGLHDECAWLRLNWDGGPSP